MTNLVLIKSENANANRQIHPELGPALAVIDLNKDEAPLSECCGVVLDHNGWCGNCGNNEPITDEDGEAIEIIPIKLAPTRFDSS